jgi:hypothetical protein
MDEREMGKLHKEGQKKTGLISFKLASYNFLAARGRSMSDNGILSYNKLPGNSISL